MSTGIEWLGTPDLQFSSQADHLNNWRVRVPHREGWKYYLVPPAVVIVLASVLSEHRATDERKDLPTKAQAEDEQKRCKCIGPSHWRGCPHWVLPY